MPHQAFDEAGLPGLTTARWPSFPTPGGMRFQRIELRFRFAERVLQSVCLVVTSASSFTLSSDLPQSGLKLQDQETLGTGLLCLQGRN